ncbi:MAG: EF-hand domain-containing protein [Maricaulis sp.]|uniref:EF-hand domain-containing protein n=1 Tax=Maricaulis sp. TaxID=1486257 RepID=UPI001B223269|nr:EF-hand domain-containing protein [Maricaulis sp.]MBO6729314.1 EF-hand domain-containing protein [Maricaulis sp.]MBO6848341.1 EF-hand domain-containing protein [Maricaulis sp.]MBO6878321.1 EF-hand domain-containing protein [Maricaulis sp.]
MTRREKRSESLEVRLGHQAKQDFMQACKDKGLTASEVIRDFVEAYPVKPRRRVWATMSMPNKEPVMSFSLVAVLSASLAASTFLPTQSAIGDRNDPQAMFAQLDADGDGRFAISSLYEFAGLTADGQLTEAMIEEVTTSARASLTSQSALIQEQVLSVDFERMIARALDSAQEGATLSIRAIFDDMDTNSDSWISRQEFMSYDRV